MFDVICFPFVYFHAISMATFLISRWRQVPEETSLVVQTRRAAKRVVEQKQDSELGFMAKSYS